MNSKFNNLVFSVRYSLRSLHNELNDESRGITALKIGSVANTLSWRVDGWLKCEARLWWTGAIASALELVCLEALEQGYTNIGGVLDDGDLDSWFDEHAERIMREFFCHAMQRVMQNHRSESNPISAMQRDAERDAALKVVEDYCGGGYAMFSADVAADIFNGREKRKQERAAARRLIPVKVTVFKQRGQYVADALNCDGTVLEQNDLAATTKPRAKEEAYGWRYALQQKHKTVDNQLPIINVEVL